MLANYKPKQSTLNMKNVKLRSGKFLLDKFEKDIIALKKKNNWSNADLAITIGMKRTSGSQISNLLCGMYEARKLPFEKLCNEHNLNPNKYFVNVTKQDNRIYELLNLAHSHGISDNVIANQFGLKSTYQIKNARKNKSFVTSIPKKELKSALSCFIRLKKQSDRFNSQI